MLIPRGLSGRMAFGFLAASFALWLAPGSPVTAADLTGIVSGAGDEARLVTGNSNNDDSIPPPVDNKWTPGEPESVSLTAGHTPAEVVFQATNRGKGSPHETEYVFLMPVNNESGKPWAGLQLELGFGTGSGFQRASVPGPNFDADPGGPTWFSVASTPPTTFEPTLAIWENTSWQTRAPTARLSVDVPDLAQSQVPADSWTGSGYETTLRFTALPEPATGLVVLVAALPAGLARPRRRGAAH